jgi:hypothetical protein
MQQLYNDLINHYHSRVGRHILVTDGSGIQQNEKHVGFKLDIVIYIFTKKKQFVFGVEMYRTIYHNGA